VGLTRVFNWLCCVVALLASAYLTHQESSVGCVVDFSPSAYLTHQRKTFLKKQQYQKNDEDSKHMNTCLFSVLDPHREGIIHGSCWLIKCHFILCFATLTCFFPSFS